MYEIFADLHVHIGRSELGKPIKITAARSLNFANIAKECVERKGINLVGIIDCASPYIIDDICDSGDTLKYLRNKYPHSAYCGRPTFPSCRWLREESDPCGSG